MRQVTNFATGVLLALPMAFSPAFSAEGAAQEADTLSHAGDVETGTEMSATYPIDPRAAPVPFGPGEFLEYKVKVGPFNVGGGYMAIDTVEAIQGFPSYLLHWALKGSILFGAKKIDNDYRSWMDVESLMSRRYIRDLHESDFVRRKHYEMYPEELMWELIGEDLSGDLASALPLDEISFVYFLRTLDLEVGKTIEFSRYFKESGNPVRIEVLRRDHRSTDAGEFDTIVIRPVIPGANFFAEEDHAEIHLSDDENRYVVFMKSELGILGMSLSMTLKSVTPGQRIHSEAAGRQQQ